MLKPVFSRFTPIKSTNIFEIKIVISIMEIKATYKASAYSSNKALIKSTSLTKELILHWY